MVRSRGRRGRGGRFSASGSRLTTLSRVALLGWTIDTSGIGKHLRTLLATVASIVAVPSNACLT